MGFNTSVLVVNDALSFIEDDPEFGKKLSDAIQGIGYRRYPDANRDGTIDVAARAVKGGIHCNAATVIETHHADDTSIIAFGGNYATKLGLTFGYSHHQLDNQIRMVQDILKELKARKAKLSNAKSD